MKHALNTNVLEVHNEIDVIKVTGLPHFLNLSGEKWAVDLIIPTVYIL